MIECPTCHARFETPQDGNCPVCHTRLDEALIKAAEPVPAEAPAETVATEAARPQADVVEAATAEAAAPEPGPPEPSPPEPPPPDPTAGELALHDCPTIAVIGSYDVGKSFYIRRLCDLLHADGYQPEEIDAEPGEAALMAGRDAAVREALGRGGSRDGSKDVDGAPQKTEATRRITAHLFVHPTRTQFQVVDIPGEYFFGGMAEGDLDRLDDVQVRKFWKVLGRADGLILVLRAFDVFGVGEDLAATPSGDDLTPKPLNADSAIRLLGAMRSACNLIEEKVAEAGGVDAAVRLAAGMSRFELQAWRLKNQRRSAKPLYVLFSQSHVCFGRGGARASVRDDGVLRETDPFLSAALAKPELVGKTREGFALCRFDFLTAYEGESQDKVPDVASDQFGVRAPLDWLLALVAPKKPRLPQAIRARLALDRLDAMAQASDWAVSLRRFAHPRFAAALKKAKV